MSITIKDIARIAGVSTSTVSLVISGKGYISDKTRAKIQTVIDEYNYRPLRAARQLSANRTGNVGFIISDLHMSRSEAFYSRILLGTELEARNYNTYILLSTVPVNMSDLETIPRFLKGRDVDGVIIAGSVATELLEYTAAQKIPAVLIDYRMKDMQMDAVLIDNRSGITKVVEHLVGQGLRQIGFIGGSLHHPSIKERLEAYILELERLGLSDIARDDTFRYTELEETSAEMGIKGTRKILKTHPDLDAIICVNDTTATGCLQFLHSKGISVPDQICVAGFDDVNYAAVSHPPLTSVHVPKVEMGMAAMRLLMDRIQNPDPLFQTRLIPVELITRLSTMRMHD